MEARATRRPRAAVFTVAVCLVGAAFSEYAPALTAQTKDAAGPPSAAPKEVLPSNGTATAVANSQDDRTASEPPGSVADLRPRLDFFVPSVKNLLSELQRSHSGVFFSYLKTLLSEKAGASADGIDSEQADAILARMAKWPDTAVSVATFAPDRAGRVRWAVRVDWPVKSLAERASSILDTEAADELFEGLRVVPADDNGFVVRLDEEPLAFLISQSPTSSFLASHRDLPLGGDVFAGSEETEKDGASLVVCRLNLTGTEKDSGATVFSSFNVVTDVVYAGRVDDGGDWQETVHVHWPPISGMGAKAMFGRVKQTFFVPRTAYGAMAFKTLMVPGMLENMIGFGPQVTFDPNGGMEVFGEQMLGPIASSIGSEMCVTVLPGSGFIPMPDIVVQVRSTRAKRLMENIMEAAKLLNEEFRLREQPEPWHVAELRDRKVVWSDGANQFPGMMMPLVMRPVLFTTTEVDARDKEREFLVVAWTSTSPKRFVRRWLDLSRADKKKLFLPKRKKTNGQLWLNWSAFYGWLSPYANLAIGVVATDALLPSRRELATVLTDATVTIKTRYTGLQMKHSGPVPIGALIVPTFFASSVMPDESGGSDLARERLASQRLKVFHHHAKLFKKDIGRWPAELEELDGYIDFAGHPGLLKLQLSSRKGWTDMFESIFGGDDDHADEVDEDVIDDDDELDLDDELFVIEWGSDSWRLGLAKGTMEHLEALFIDQDGEIHRIEKKPETQDVKESAEGEEKAERVLERVAEQALVNMQRRYHLSGGRRLKLNR